MRSVAGASVCLALVPFGVVFASGPTSVPAATAPTSTTPAGDADAAKHAKRTGCLKQAAGKNLTGKERAAYVKDCISR